MHRILMAASLALALAACAPAPQKDKVASSSILKRSDCLTTGSRIPLKPGQCAMQPGRVYSKEELERIGAASTAEALRRIDPSISGN